MAVHSTGVESQTDDNGHVDEVYKPGSYAIFFVNDHPLGDFNQAGEFLGKIDIAGMTMHASNNLYVRCSAGRDVMIDDFIWWKEDLTNDGQELFELFDNGRGGTSNVQDWVIY